MTEETIRATDPETATPEEYYETNLRGRFLPEIQKEIRFLRREIRRLRKNTEKIYSSGLFDSDRLTPAGQARILTHIKYDRACLKHAIKAYEAAGGTYAPSKEERKSEDFDRALPSVHKLIFSVGGFPGGYKTSIGRVFGDHVVLSERYSYSPNPEDFLIVRRRRYPDPGLRRRLRPVPFTKEEFVAGLREIHIGEWKKEYVNMDILDGEQWKLKIQYDDVRKSFTVYGSNAYPYNFKEPEAFLKIGEDETEG